MLCGYRICCVVVVVNAVWSYSPILASHSHRRWPHTAHALLPPTSHSTYSGPPLPEHGGGFERRGGLYAEQAIQLLQDFYLAGNPKGDTRERGAHGLWEARLSFTSKARASLQASLDAFLHTRCMHVEAVAPQSADIVTCPHHLCPSTSQRLLTTCPAQRPSQRGRWWTCRRGSWSWISSGSRGSRPERGQPLPTRRVVV